MRSADRRRFSSKTCVYVLRVMRTSECPSTSMISRGDSPCAWSSAGPEPGAARLERERFRVLAVDDDAVR